jgi:hypothetical protein
MKLRPDPTPLTHDDDEQDTLKARSGMELTG